MSAVFFSHDISSPLMIFYPPSFEPILHIEQYVLDNYEWLGLLPQTPLFDFRISIWVYSFLVRYRNIISVSDLSIMKIPSEWGDSRNEYSFNSFRVLPLFCHQKRYYAYRNRLTYHRYINHIIDNNSMINILWNYSNLLFTETLDIDILVR